MFQSMGRVGDIPTRPSHQVSEYIPRSIGTCKYYALQWEHEYFYNCLRTIYLLYEQNNIHM